MKARVIFFTSLVVVLQVYFATYRAIGMTVPTTSLLNDVKWMLLSSVNIAIDSLYIVIGCVLFKQKCGVQQKANGRSDQIFIVSCQIVLLCGIALTAFKYSLWPYYSRDGMVYLLKWEMKLHEALLYRWITHEWWRAAVWCSVVGVIGPFVEELLYRGMLQKWLQQICSKPVAILLSSLVFSLSHDFWFGEPTLRASFDEIVEKCVVGSIFGCLYSCTRSLPLCIAAHSWWNIERLGRYVARYYYYNLVIPS